MIKDFEGAVEKMAATEMDIDDENDVPLTKLSKHLATTHISPGSTSTKTATTTTDKDSDIVHMSTSGEESTIEDGALTPDAGFFIDSPSNHEEETQNDNPDAPCSPQPQHTQLTSPWPSTPPKRSPPQHNLIPTSCPQRATPKSPTHQRPLFISSSSGALFPPISSSYDAGEEDGGNYIDSPATRAANALQALENSNIQHIQLEQLQHNKQHRRDLSSILEQRERGSIMDKNLLDEINKKEEGGELGLDDIPDISRQETFHTSHHSHEHERRSDNKAEEYNIPIDKTPLPPRSFEAYPDPRISVSKDYEIPALYKFTPHSLSGSILTYISKKFVPTHRQHTHGGSALAGFFALLLVTCANYMLGPMRDAAALAVGVSHIPALTLASTVLALGSSVPVGWLFEAPDPRRRRVWKRMGLTRGETQGTSLALFYRVFAFLLLSYALGFKIVDTYGGGGRNTTDNESGVAEEEEESAIVLVISFFIRLMVGMGIPVIKILSSCEQFASDIIQRDIFFFSTTSIVATLELHSEESIPGLFLHAASCVVNKFGKVIYIMFFLVVHLMKLHSLSLLWGVTTEAMEYEETAEQRFRNEGRGMSGTTNTSSSGGLVLMGSSNNGNGENKSNTTSATQSPMRNSKGSKPSKSSLRLKRLGFVGFGGTLGGILGR